MEKLDTNCPNTWCPGCGNFGALQAVKGAIEEMIASGTAKENIAVVTDIGCNSKIADYLNVNSFYGLHGRSIPVAEGMKLANPKLQIFVFLGDGAALDEGISHLIHSAKRNSDINVILLNNRVFALTTGQFTAVSPKGLKGKSTPEGSIEDPINPLEILMASNASFISRGYALKVQHLKKLIVESAKHKGFSFVEVLQPCVSFLNNMQFYNEKAYEAVNDDPSSKEKALKLIKEWDYDSEEKVPLGLFYKIQKPSYEELMNKVKTEKETDILECLQKHS
ncbi:MAG: thiamine pyrophosphate-dependent enzyme [Candidatus Paceibacterota bacterium]|jgi:2-oxoglutarate ferredoxin oxidoreductase subunit beta